MLMFTLLNAGLDTLQLDAFHERFPNVGHNLIPPEETLALEVIGSILLLLREWYLIVGFHLRVVTD